MGWFREHFPFNTTMPLGPLHFNREGVELRPVLFGLGNFAPTFHLLLRG